MSTANGMWGDLSNLEIVRTPKSILEEQAKLLTSATKNSLVGQVRKVEGPFSKKRFVYDLDIVVPSLNNYSYTVLRIEHDVDLYPILVRPSEMAPGRTCSNEEAFCNAVEAILSSDGVKRVISRLLSQVA